MSREAPTELPLKKLNQTGRGKKDELKTPTTPGEPRRDPFRPRVNTGTSIGTGPDCSKGSVASFRGRKDTATSRLSLHGVSASMQSMSRKAYNTVSSSMISIKENYHHSRRSGSFYAIEDLPKTVGVSVDFGVMLGSTVSISGQKLRAPIDVEASAKCIELGAPSLKAVRRRIGFVFIMGIIWNLLYAAPLFGFSSLRPVLQEEGFFSHVCREACDNELSLEEFGCYDGFVQKYPNGSRYRMACKLQEETLNQYYTIGTSILSGSTMLLGIIMDSHGSRILRIVGMIMFLLSTLIFTAISYLPEELSWLMLPAVILNGVGGITIVFTSFQFGNLFSAARSTVIAVMIGSYNASSFVYTLFLNLYRMGVSFPVLMLVHGGLLFIALIESWFNVPVKPIPTLEEQRSRKSPPRTSVRRNMAVQNNAFTIEEESEANESKEGSTDDAGQKLKIQTVTRRESIFAAAELNPPSFLAVIISWPCLLSLLTMCITQLRIVMFIGQLALFLRSSPDFTEETPVADREDKVTFYLTIFGWMQLFCLLVAPVIGKVLDKDLDTCRDDPIAGVRSRDSNSTNAFRRVQALRNTRNAYLITEACLLAIGVLMVLPIPIWAQYITFLLVTWIRTFLHSTAGGLYVNVFHYAHLGKLTGLGSIVSAVFCLLNDPLFKIVNNILDQDPFWLNILVLVLSLLGLLLPLYLTRFAKKVEKTLNEIDSRNKLSK